jgi:hypothetical protein
MNKSFPIPLRPLRQRQIDKAGQGRDFGYLFRADRFGLADYFFIERNHEMWARAARLRLFRGRFFFHGWIITLAWWIYNG